MTTTEITHPTRATTANNQSHPPDLDHTAKEYDVGHDNEDTVEKLDDDDDEDYEDYEDYGEDYDPEAEAEAVARALGNQIWNELGQSLMPTGGSTDSGPAGESAPITTELDQARVSEGLNMDSDPRERTLVTAASSSELPTAQSPHPQPNPFSGSNSPPIFDPMIETIKTMLSLALSDPHVHYALIATIVPGPVANGANLYTILNQSVFEGRVNPELAQPLSILISALASGSMMISAESTQHISPLLDSSSLKRKREAVDEGQAWPTHPVYNPAVHPSHVSQPTITQPSEELLTKLQVAASDILRVLDPLLASGGPLHESVMVSIQRQLRQVYAFVSTCPHPRGEDGRIDNRLQEIGGLIQMIGILTGVPIAQSADSFAHTDASSSPDSGRNGQASRASNNTIGTEVYPCPYPTCSRVFSKLSSLRTHERTHSEGRPYRCEYAGCPASFARNHDLRRHEKSHERQMFRCRGCDKLFSRRDALRRHKTNEKAPDECREAPMDTSTVQHDGEPPRVTRVWQNHPEGGDWPRDSDAEDGEIQPDAISNACRIVGTIHATLQKHVTRGLHIGEKTGSLDKQPPELEPLPEHFTPEEPDPAAMLYSDVPVTTMQQEVVTTRDSQAVSTSPREPIDTKTAMVLPSYGLDDEHANMLERVIAEAQAEAEAALCEESYDEDGEDGEWNEEHEDGPDIGAELEANKLVC